MSGAGKSRAPADRVWQIAAALCANPTCDTLTATAIVELATQTANAVQAEIDRREAEARAAEEDAKRESTAALRQIRAQLNAMPWIENVGSSLTRWERGPIRRDQIEMDAVQSTSGNAYLVQPNSDCPLRAFAGDPWPEGYGDSPPGWSK